MGAGRARALFWREARRASLLCFGIGALLIVAGLVAPGHPGWVHDRWMALARLISRVTTPVFMSAVFFLVVTPIGMLRRALAKNPLVHEEKDGSFWKPSPASMGRRGSMERQF